MKLIIRIIALILLLVLMYGGACGALPIDALRYWQQAYNQQTDAERDRDAQLLGGEFEAAAQRQKLANPYLRVVFKNKISSECAAEDAEIVCGQLQIVRCSRCVPWSEHPALGEDICCQMHCCYGRCAYQEDVGYCRSVWQALVCTLAVSMCGCFK